MMPALDAGIGIDETGRRGEHPLPAPLPGGARVLARERARQRDPPEAQLVALDVQLANPLEMGAERLHDRLRRLEQAKPRTVEEARQTTRSLMPPNPRRKHCAVPNCSLLQAFLVPLSEDTFSLFLAGMLFGSAWGAVVTLVFAVPYGVLLGAWPWLVRSARWAEETRFGLALAAGALALPGALIVGLETAEFAGTIRPREFVVSFLAAQVGGWAGLLAPRILFKSLAPGRLIATPRRAAA